MYFTETIPTKRITEIKFYCMNDKAKRTKKAILMKTDCNGRYVFLSLPEVYLNKEKQFQILFLNVVQKNRLEIYFNLFSRIMEQ